MTRICRTCGQEKALDAFDPGGPKNRPGYRRPHCKDCRNTTARTKHAHNPERRRLVAKRFRERHPDTIKTWDKARWQKTKARYASDPAFRQHELQRSLASYHSHAAHAQKRERAWRTAHPEAGRVRSKRWRTRHPDKVRAMKRAAYHRRCLLDPAYRNKQRTRLRLNASRSRQSRNEAARRRRARVAGAALIEKIQRQLIFARDRWICQLCFARVTPDDATIDHVIPVAEGGNHTYQNLVTAHLTCNQRKGARRVPQQQRLF